MRNDTKEFILITLTIATTIMLLFLGGGFMINMKHKQEREMFLLESEYDRQYKFTPLSDHHILIEGNKIHIDSLKNYIFDYE